MNEKNMLLEIVEGVAFILKKDERLKDFTITPGEERDAVGIKFENKDFTIFAAIENVLLNMKSAEELNEFIKEFPEYIIEAKEKALELEGKQEIKSTDDEVAIRQFFEELFENADSTDKTDSEKYNPGKAFFRCPVNEDLSFIQAEFLKHVNMVVINPAELSDDAVTRDVLGVTVAYYISDEHGHAMHFVTNTEMHKYDLTENHLYSASLINVYNNSGAMFRDEVNNKEINPLERAHEFTYAYSMADKEYGSMAFLIPGALKAMSMFLGEDFYFFIADSDKVVVHPKSIVPLNTIKEGLKKFPPMVQNIFLYDSDKDEFFSVRK